MSVPPTNQVYQGYAALSRYISGVDGLHVFHRFGELHTRNLLYLQDELRDLEETLHGRDLQPDIEHGSRRSDGDADRRRLMLLIKTKLKEYDDCLLAYAAIRKLERPKKRHLETLRAFFEGQQPLVESEMPLLEDHDPELLSLKVMENDQCPPWITEKLVLGDWAPGTRDPVSSNLISILISMPEALRGSFCS
ncbi:uncharacterized protein RHO25_012510 [Cercospora beticola]|uniref:DUF6594 domain-containing protein n=1 Tax=Cercospora beticola TaxID=122368 RepID=A0ABZ0P814_CERBT|nr:hypothetical protein RHO25_012510 [Cercospora beticola]